MEKSIKIKINIKKYLATKKNEKIIANLANECIKNIKINLKIN